MADFIPGLIPLKCPSSESVARYNDQPQSGLIDILWQTTESILLYNEPPQSGLVDNVTSTEFITYTN